MKWLLSLIFLTLFFVISSFFIPNDLALAYRWMTLGMATVSFIFYFLTKKNNPKNVNGNLAAITIKFMSSTLVFVLYIIIYKSQNKIDYYFFIVAYILFSLVSYTGAYYETKKKQTPV